jgi:voltage-gated sodium channel
MEESVDKATLENLKTYSKHQQKLMKRKSRDYLQAKRVMGTSSKQRGLIGKIAFAILNYRWFDAIIGSVIFINTIMIGLECELSLDPEDFDKNHRRNFEKVEYVFLAVYIVELLLRLVADGMQAFRSGWVICDAFIVGGSLFDLFLSLFVWKWNTSQVDMQMLTIIRMGRIFRLVRAVRLFVQFRTLWMLIRGVIGCTTVMFHACIVVGLILYISAIVGMELISKPILSDPGSYDHDLVQYTRKYLRNVQTVALSLCTFIFKGHQVYEPMIQAQPLSFFYFSPVMAVLFIGLMNMITATIVQKYVSMQKTDSEAELSYMQQERRRLLPRLYELFSVIDADKNKTIEIDEIYNAPPEVQTTLMQIMKVDDIQKIFSAIDVDDSGTVTVDEFIEGLLWMVEGGTKEQLKLEKLMTSMHRKQDRIDEERDLFIKALHDTEAKADAAVTTVKSAKAELKISGTDPSAEQKGTLDEMRGEIQRSQAEIQAQRDSLRGLEQNQGALESTLALVANSVQQMLGGQEALGAQLAALAEALASQAPEGKLELRRPAGALLELSRVTPPEATKALKN